MGRPAVTIKVTENEKRALKKLSRNGSTEQRYAIRARIILGLHEGKSNKEMADLLNVSQVVICKWRKRFARHRLEGLKDAKRSGRKIRYGHEQRIKLIQKTMEKPKAPQWTVRDLEAELMNEVGIKKSQINKILNEMDLKPHQVRSWLQSKDPEFEPKMVDICGLYLNPPENALILSVDEKPAIQALGRKNPDKPMRPGNPAKRDFEYARNGTVDLFAAFLVHEGKVIGMPSDQHTAEDFLDFLDHLNEELPKDKSIHIIMDNLKTHSTPEVKAWFARHLRWEIHFTPKHASWLNQVELWFSILSKRRLKNGVFNSKKELIDTIMSFIEKYNETGKPFKWTYRGTPLFI
jgi:transposase